MHKSHGVETIKRVGSVGVALVMVWMLSAQSARAAPMTWEMDGTLRSASGVFAQFMPANAAVTLTLFGDASQAATIPASCPASANAATFTVTGAQLQVGSLTWTKGNIGFIERHDEAGFCGQVGAALDFNSFDWVFMGTPPDPALMLLSRVYAELSPVDEAAVTLGEQLNAVNSVPDGFGVGGPGTGLFSYTGTFAAGPTPVPEPATFTLVALGIAGLSARRRLTNRRQ
jgi:PEP-CTERM motif